MYFLFSKAKKVLKSTPCVASRASTKEKVLFLPPACVANAMSKTICSRLTFPKFKDTAAFSHVFLVLKSQAKMKCGGRPVCVNFFLFKHTLGIRG